MTREVDGHDREVLRADRRSAPEPPRLREPVQQGQRWPRTPQFDLEGHVG